MKVAIIKGRSKWYLPSLLTRIFTGCRAYHIGFYSEASNYFYDMDVMRRRIEWNKWYNKKVDEVEFFHCRVPESYLKGKILNSTATYGYGDYIQFLLRRLGFKVKNRGGMICSEMVNRDLREYGVKTPWDLNDAPPSPCEFLKWYKKEGKYGGN